MNDGGPSVRSSRHLEAGERESVLALLTRVEAHDGVAAVGEEGLLDLREPHRDVLHLVLRDHRDVAGYAWTDGRSGELAVDPARRRRGYGSTLASALLEAEPRTAVWAHGALPGSLAFGEHHGATVTRDLWQMCWEVGAVVVGELAEGYAARAFTGEADGADGRALVAANAEAFADHPEQGRFSIADLARRMGEAWWDPARLRLVEHVESGELAGFCWVKPEGDRDEIYLVGVADVHRGKGLARWMAQDAQAASFSRGAATMNLYVEGDNVFAVRAYRGVGFEQCARDVQLTVLE
ncbi:MAG: mycothiol synthase [bacterium]|nr:mycothiol synthase [bacterium]